MITFWIIAITDWEDIPWIERIITVGITALMDYSYLCKYTDLF